MTNRITGALLGATALSGALTIPAAAQTKPVVATITVSVSISNIDTEWLKRTIGGLAVRCELSDAPAPPPPGTAQGRGFLGSGESGVPLQEKLATTSVRSTMNYSGSLLVSTYAADNVRVRDGGGPSDPETQAQNAAADAIKRARSYVCYFVKPGGTADVARTLEDGYAKNTPEKGANFSVSGTFPPR